MTGLITAEFEFVAAAAADDVAMEKREAFAGEGEPMALFGLAAIAAAYEFVTCWLSLRRCNSFMSCRRVASCE